MNRKNIFKTLAAAMLMPAMLLTTSCSSDDDALNAPAENIAKKGYTIPVTVNVTRQGDDATTRATYTYDEYTKKGTLAFSAGDKLFVSGSYNDYENVFAGTLDYVSDGTFSGTITTETEWTGTIDELLADAVAQLLSAGYESYGYLSITENNGYDDEFANDRSKAITTSKATAVEQFSLEQGLYNSGSGFELEPSNAILYFTINGLEANTSVAVDFTDSFAEITTSGNVTTDGDGTATFAIGIWSDSDLKDCSLTVDGNAITIVSESKTVAAGKIYNITRTAYDNEVNLSSGKATVPAGEHWHITGTTSTRGTDIITIGAGAKVTLDGVTIPENNIKCLGDATIILMGDNSVTSWENAAIQAGGEGTTLTIMGTGSLIATSDQNNAPGIGGNQNGSCGNITINGGTITATGKRGGAGIGSGAEQNCGDITITGGTITATGGEAAAGIGSGNDRATCGDILISGGTVTATGGNNAAGIGCGSEGHCGDITITDGVTKVTARKGTDSDYCIGLPNQYSDSNTCGTITIGEDEDEKGFGSDDEYTYPED